MPVNLSGVGLNQTFADNLSTKDKQDIKQFDSLEKAVNYANQHQGDEAVVKTKDETGKDTFAVISLKSGAKATDVFDPKSVNFGSSLITRDNKRIEVVDSPDEMNGAETTQSLVNIAVNDKANGLTKSQAYNNYDNRLPAYQANMVSLAGRVNDSETKLQVKLETLKKATPPDLIAISSIEQKLDELKTSKGILRAKMLILPKTAGDGDDGKGAKIPGTQIHIGDLRTKSLDAITPLRQRMTELQTQLIGEKSPSKIDSLKGQINLLQKEVNDVVKSNAQIAEAQTKMVGRLGSLNTINSSINTARKSLEGKTVKLQQLTEQFNNDPREATFKKDIQGKIDSIKSEINQTRASLISQMNTQIVEFEKNSPKIGRELQAGPKAVISLLREEVTKLENVDVTKVEETVKSNNFLGVVKQAASKWDGISPQEGVMAGNIVENNAGFIKDYKTLQAGVKDLQADVDIAKKLPQFGFNKLVERNLLSAQGWTAGTTALTGVQANKAINTAYDNLDRQFSQYVGGSEHPAANWMTYGKYASREAGSQIQSLEASLESIKTLLKVDGSTENDKRALTALVKVMDTGPMTKQAMRMAAASMGIKDADKFTSPQLIE
ncbi:MAG: hypothetical protein H7263_01200, partial [Candidatus Sericytochromatia bacterium]|nr:hypothetical protein [Candidatus Sericytochromatia bacterium]